MRNFPAFLEAQETTKAKGRSSDLRTENERPSQITSNRGTSVASVFISFKRNAYSSGTVQDSHLIPF